MKNLARQPLCAVLIAISVGTLCTASDAAADEIERSSLKGLKGFVVLVERLRADAENNGLTTDSIRTDVELRLRQAGITVYPSVRDDPSPAKAYVYVNINLRAANGTATGLFAASVSVELQQWLRSRVSDLEFPGATWSRGTIVTVGASHLRDIRDTVKDRIDEFINDYLAANPKQP